MTTETVEITYSNFVIGIFSQFVQMGYTGIVPPERDEACFGDAAAIETYRYMSERYSGVHTKFSIFRCGSCIRTHEWRQQLHDDAYFVFRPIRSDDSVLYFDSDALTLYVQDTRYFHGSEEMWKDLAEHFRESAEPVLHRWPYRKSTRYP